MNSRMSLRPVTLYIEGWPGDLGTFDILRALHMSRGLALPSPTERCLKFAAVTRGS
jgi:hypothetical protein